MASYELDSAKKRMVEALKATKGIVTAASEASGVPRSTHYTWMNDDPEYKQAVEDAQEVAIDFVEGKLISLIEGGDTASTIFFMKTRGKKRGYIERQEHDLNLTSAVPIQIILPPDEQPG